MQITVDQVLKISGSRANKTIVTNLVDFICKEGDNYFLDTPRRVAEFIGQSCYESDYYTTLTERLNYSEAALEKAWPSRFKTAAACKPYINNPTALADYVYGGRMGNTAKNDGYNYRGRGIKQLTGKANYTAFTAWAKSKYPDAPDFVKNPDLVMTYPWAILSGVWYWVARKVYTYADKDDTHGATVAINGGTLGLADREVLVSKAKIVFMPVAPSKQTATPPKTPDKILLDYQEKLNKIAVYKNIDAIDVGTPDGWFGPKTKTAIEVFQGSTGGSVPITGVLDDATKVAIDQIIAIINIGKYTNISEDLNKKNTNVVVSEVPVAIPDRLISTLNKPVYENKSILTVLMGSGSILLVVYNKGVEFFTALPQYTQIALLVMIFAGIVFAYLSVKEHLRSQKGLTELKQNVAQATVDIQKNQQSLTQ
jgi:putative chitinase